MIINNRKAPRYKATNCKVFDISFVKALMKEEPRIKNYTFAQIGEVITKFGERIAQSVIDNPAGVLLPEGLGIIFLSSCKVKHKLCIDYNKSLKEGVLVQFQNWETDNHVAKVIWTTKPRTFTCANRKLWKFKALRPFKNKISASFPKNWNRYVKLKSTSHPNISYEKFRYEEKHELDNKEQLRIYNEFDI